MRRALILLFLCIPTIAAAEPQLVSFGETGLQLGSTSLYAKAVDGAAHDPAQELIWFRSAGTLYVIDLRDPARKPVAIATKFPDGGFKVEGFSNADYSTTYSGLFPTLVAGKSSKIKTGMGAYGGIWEDQDADAKKAIKKIKLTGKKWLTKQAKRVARTSPAAPTVATLSGKIVKITLPDDACDGAGVECGDTAAFGDTAYQLIVVSSGCGDACHASCVFYDPKTKKFADPLTTTAWTASVPPDIGASCFPENYGLRAGGEYFSGSARCKVAASGTTCTAAEGWNHVGWVE
jgi:hypothetical protein